MQKRKEKKRKEKIAIIKTKANKYFEAFGQLAEKRSGYIRGCIPLRSNKQVLSNKNGQSLKRNRSSFFEIINRKLVAQMCRYSVRSKKTSFDQVCTKKEGEEHRPIRDDRHRSIRSTKACADSDTNVGRVRRGAGRTESIVRIAHINKSGQLRRSASQHQSGLSDLLEASFLVETLVFGRSSMARAVFHLQLLSKGQLKSFDSMSHEVFINDFELYRSKPLKPGEQSFRGGKMFCTDPCYNELFSGVCNTYDCHQPPQEAADANTGDAANDRCLSCKRLMGVRNESGQFPDGKFPGYLAAKQKHLMWAPDDSGQSQGIICGPHLVHNFIGEECVRCSQPVYAAESCYSMNLPWHLRVS